MNEKLILQLDRITDAIQGPGNLKGAAEIVRGAASENAPTGFGELKGSIRTELYDTEDGEHVAEVYTKKPYGPYVELGTGPKGMADHNGISPEVNPSYTPKAWWIHESQIDPKVAAKYHFHHIDTKDGRFYLSYGQAAQPFLYPALKDNKDAVLKTLKEGYKKAIKEVL